MNMKNVVALVLGLGLCFSARADWLAWTLDFGDDGAGSNPLPSGQEKDAWIVLSDSSSGTPQYYLTPGKISWGPDASLDGTFGGETKEVSAATLGGTFTATDWLYYIEIGDYATGTPSAAFRTETFSASALSRYIRQNEYDPGEVWNAAVGTTWTAVPEPTGGLLVLIGMAGLALKRKRV